MFFIGVGSKCSQNLWLNIQTKVCIFRLVNHVALNVNSKLGASASQFEPANKNSNSRGFLQSAEPYGSKCQFENGTNASEFEPLTENARVEAGNGQADTKNKKIHNNITMTNEKLEPAKKFSNHIKFIDYIPTHELITYRHLFAYGFYVE